MGEGSFKAPKGLIRVRTDVRASVISDITISGDFFMYPEDRLWELEYHLLGTKATKNGILVKVREFYEATGIMTPGVSPEDFTEAIVRAVESSRLMTSSEDMGAPKSLKSGLTDKFPAF